MLKTRKTTRLRPGSRETSSVNCHIHTRGINPLAFPWTWNVETY
jgi:hypothetical protein